MPAGPGPGSVQPEGCVSVGSPESYNRIRRLAAPNFRNASIDKLDSCNEVSIGLLATVAITLAIWVVAMPTFEIAGLPWIRTWESSFMMTLDQFKDTLESVHLLPKSVHFSLTVEDLEHHVIAESALEHDAVVAALEQRVVADVGNNLTRGDVAVQLYPDSLNSSIRAGCTINVPPESDADVIHSTLAASLPQRGNRSELDVRASPRTLANATGRLIVYANEPAVTHFHARPAFEYFDEENDGFVSFEEFYNGTSKFDPPLPRDEAKHVFDGLDQNRNGVLEYLEFKDALSQQELYHRSGESFTTVPSTTTMTSTSTSSTSRTDTETSTLTRTSTVTDTQTVTRTTTHTDAEQTTNHPPTTTMAMTTALPHPSPATTPSKPVVVFTPTVATVHLRVPALGFSNLTFVQKASIAGAYRQDLAYAAGILSSQVMDIAGRAGCVSLSAVPSGTSEAGRLLREALEGGLFARGCLPIPDGATVEDIEAVVTSGTEVRKMVRDFLAVDAENQVRADQVEVSVVAQESCRLPDTIQDSAVSFCEGQQEEDEHGEETSTPKPTELTTHSAPSKGATEPDADLLTMLEFLQRMGATDGDSPRDAFAALDANRNEFADPAEFHEATEHFHPPLTRPESVTFYDWLDSNHDGRVESIEFATAFERAFSPDDDTPAPLTLAQYRQSLGHERHYSKVGVGLCSTANEAWPGSIEHPEATSTKEDCQGLCDSQVSCGAFAFKLGGPCKVYPSGVDYPDTTPMTDVECFVKAFSDEAQFDLLVVRLLFRGDTLSNLTEARTSAVSTSVGRSLTFEAGASPNSVMTPSGVRGTCSLSAVELGAGPQAAESGAGAEAICILDIPSGRRIEDLTAVVTAAGTKERVAGDLSLQFQLLVQPASIAATVQGTSVRFRTSDVDSNGVLSIDEFLAAAQTFTPPLPEPTAEYAFRGLDANKDNTLSPNEFEANGMEGFFELSMEG